MQISTIKNRNFEKPFRNPPNRTNVKFLKKIFFWISLQQNLLLHMLSHRENGENRRKRSEIIFENLPSAYKDLI